MTKPRVWGLVVQRTRPSTRPGVQGSGFVLFYRSMFREITFFPFWKLYDQSILILQKGHNFGFSDFSMFGIFFCIFYTIFREGSHYLFLSGNCMTARF